MKDIVTNGLADHYAWDGVNHDKFAGSIHDDLRFTVRAIKANDGEQAILVCVVRLAMIRKRRKLSETNGGGSER